MFIRISYKQKKGLEEAMATLGINGLLPPKATGTRWLPHLSRGITALLRSFTALEAHLSNESHRNPKAEGLVKIMLTKEIMGFVLLLDVRQSRLTTQH